jgi:hypothetical protein
LKVSKIKNSYKAFIRKLITGHDDEAYMVKHIVALCEKAGYNNISDERVLGVLRQCAGRIKYDGNVWWGSPKAIAQIKGDK